MARMDLSTHTKRQLSYAEGYLALGMKKNAGEALAEIVGEDRTATPVLALGLTVRIEQGDWRRAAVIGKALCTRAPEVPGHWVQWAYATRRHVGILEARAILMRGLGLHPLEGMFHFNLACYEAQLGNLADARVFLDTACGLDEGFVELGKADDDLEPLRGFAH